MEIDSMERNQKGKRDRKFELECYNIRKGGQVKSQRKGDIYIKF